MRSDYITLHQLHIHMYLYIYIHMYTCHIISYTTTKQPPNQVALCPSPQDPRPSFEWRRIARLSVPCPHRSRRGRWVSELGLAQNHGTNDPQISDHV